MFRFSFFISVFFFFVVFLVFPVKGFAANAFSGVNADVPHNTHTWTQTVMIETTSALTCLMIGVDTVDPQQKCLGIDAKTKKIGYVKNQGGAVGGSSTLISMLYTPPLNTGDYFRHVANNFGIVKPTYAVGTTGIGFQGLSPLLPIWTTFRNIVYLIMVVVLLIVGMAIMLRLKIDPRTVMSVENQLPKIVIGLLLVTFSFAIAGFLIDMMYVSIYLAAGVLSTAAPNAQIGASLVNIQGYNTFEFASNNLGGIAALANVPASSIGGTVLSMMTGPIITPVFGAIGGAIGFRWGADMATWLAAAIGPAGGAIPGFGSAAALITGNAMIALGTGVIAGLAANFLPGIFAYALVFLIVAAAILIALFRLWMALLFAYVYFLIDVIFAPFWIIGGIIPGSPINLENWLRDMLANLSVFPVAITMFLLGKVFITAFTDPKGGIFVPPLIGNPSNLTLIGDLIGLTIILMTPGVVAMMRDIFHAPAFKYTAVAAQQLQKGSGPPSRILGGSMQHFFGEGYHDEGDGHGPKYMLKGGPLGTILRAVGVVGRGGH